MSGGHLPGSAAPPAPAAPTPQAPASGAYTVVAGDSLYGISRKTATDINTLLSLNGLRLNSVIHPGQVLNVSGGGSTPGTPGPAPSGATYTVVRGDSLYGISRKTATDINTLLSLNGLRLNSVIHPGQVLNVSGGGSGPAPSRVIEQVTIGTSVQGRPIVAYRLGTPGGKVVLVVGTMHGHEQTGVTIAERIRDTAAIPSGIDLWVITTGNPDGSATNSRVNANGVNLNRNFSTRWEAIDCAAFARSCAGPGPASEPETQALEAFIARIRPSVSVWWHGPDNRVDVAAVYGTNNTNVLTAYANTAGMQLATIPCYPTGYCTGNATQYSNANFGGSAFVVELPTLARYALSNAAMDRHIRAAFAAAAA